MTPTDSPVGTAVLVVDATGDFTEGGRLPVTGGKAACAAITAFLRDLPDGVPVIASRENHRPHTDNGGHFAAPGDDPDYVNTFPEHGTPGHPGADYAPEIDATLIDHHVLKGWDEPAFSMFQGALAVDGTDPGESLHELLRRLNISRVLVTGIATDFCVRHTALDALRLGFDVEVLTDLIAGVAPDSSRDALTELAGLGATVFTSGDTRPGSASTRTLPVR